MICTILNQIRNRITSEQSSDPEKLHPLSDYPSKDMF
jgi:hypothetical protein